MCDLLKGLRQERIVPTILPMLCLLAAMSTSPAHATVVQSTPDDRGATALEGMWCNQDASNGETIVQYSAAGLEVRAFTVLSEADPRRIGSQATMHLTMEAPNVFIRRDFAGSDEVFSVNRDGLTVDSFAVMNRGTAEEMRRVVTTQSYHKCDVRIAFQRTQAFLSSPRAEQATRKAMQREAERNAEKEHLERENAAIEERRNASLEAYYTGLIRQLSQLRASHAAG